MSSYKAGSCKESRLNKLEILRSRAGDVLFTILALTQ